MKHLGGILGIVIIVLLIANGVYLHNVERELHAQNAPAVHEDWASIIKAAANK